MSRSGRVKAAGEAGPGELPPGLDVGPGGSSITPRVRATRHVVWALLVGWLVLVALAVVLIALL